MHTPYGSWKSPIAAESVAKGAVAYAEIQTHGEDVYWLESRPDEAGRVCLVRNGESLLPPEFSARSRVHEYGGGSYAIADSKIYFVNFVDQELYRLDKQPIRITNTGVRERYADLFHPPGSDSLIAVCETHELGAQGKPTAVVNRLVSLNLENGEVQTLHEGHDFYAAPRVRGNRLAFLAWDHPNMPWDATLLYLARLNASRRSIEQAGIIAGGNGESITEPCWGDTRLFFLSDANGWWNLWCFDDARGSHCLYESETEFGAPGWLLGSRTYAVVNDDLIIAKRANKGAEDLVIVNAHGTLTDWHSESSTYDCLVWHRARTGLACVTGSAQRASRIERLAASGESCSLLASPTRGAVAPAYFSNPEPLEFESGQGHAYAYFYPPTNPDYEAPGEDLPPLLVTTHGGPTASARSALNMRIQYYTSRGWAVADLNYAGSTGFGTAYRRKLRGNWGIADVQDCEALVNHLIRAGRVDAGRCAIRGGSAGGYTTLAALTFSDCFQAGSSFYGISDLEALAKDTHKFESRYLDSLVGPWPQMRDTYEARSPIHHTDQLSCPVAFFQGGKDTIVPPNQSERMVQALDRKGIPHAYVLYPQEGHGFRDAKNIVHSIESEYAFFCKVFDIQGAHVPPDLEVKHL